MPLNTALSLADFLNHNSSRLLATVLDFGDKGWVIVGEKLPDGARRLFPETISNPSDYLRRAQAGAVTSEDRDDEDLDEEYHALIEQWLKLQV